MSVTTETIDSLVIGIKSDLADSAVFRDLAERSMLLPAEKQIELLSMIRKMTDRDEIAAASKAFMRGHLQ